MATGFVFHELYMWHNTWNWNQVFAPSLTVQPGEHAENPETKRRFRNLLEVSGLLDQLVTVKPRHASEEELARVHSREHIARIKAMSAENGGDASALTPFGKGSFEIAQLAAGGTMAACDAVIEGRVKNAYALVRPPGHHATADVGMGFCLFANVAVAIAHARAAHKLGRIATVDWDVHHGNGTQSIFYADPTTLTISLHQDNLFPNAIGDASRRRARARARATTSTSRCRRAPAMAAISPPSSRWCCPPSTASSRNSSSCRRASMPRAWIRWAA